MNHKNENDEESWVGPAEKDPEFAAFVKKALDEIEPPPDLEKKISLILQNHKKKQLATDPSKKEE